MISVHNNSYDIWYDIRHDIIPDIRILCYNLPELLRSSTFLLVEAYELDGEVPE